MTENIASCNDNNLSCPQGWYACPAEFNGGCCQYGQRCDYLRCLNGNGPQNQTEVDSYYGYNDSEDDTRLGDDELTESIPSTTLYQRVYTTNIVITPNSVNSRGTTYISTVTINITASNFLSSGLQNSFTDQNTKFIPSSTTSKLPLMSDTSGIGAILHYTTPDRLLCIVAFVTSISAVL